MYIIQMNKTTQYLFIITICIFIFIIYKFLWKRDMITRIINKLQRRFLKCKDKCKNVDCNCNTLEGMELFGTIEGEFNNLTKSDATKIVSIPSEYTKRPLKDYVIKSSYNSAITGKYANIDMVKYLLHRGVRFLDFEIMLIDNAPMITYSYDKNIGTIETDNTLLLDNVLSMIVGSAFISPTPNPYDPLFINLRIKTENKELYNLVAKSIDSTIKSKLYTDKINNKTTLEDVMGKIVIVVDKTINRNYLNDSNCSWKDNNCYNLSHLLSLESGSDLLQLHRYSEILNLTYDNVRIEDKCKLCTSVKNMKLVLPDIINSNSNNPDVSDFILYHGAQNVMYKFYSNDQQLDNYEQLFNDNKGGILPLAHVLDYIRKHKE